MCRHVICYPLILLTGLDSLCPLLCFLYCVLYFLSTVSWEICLLSQGLSAPAWTDQLNMRVLVQTNNGCRCSWGKNISAVLTSTFFSPSFPNFSLQVEQEIRIVHRSAMNPSCSWQTLRRTWMTGSRPYGGSSGRPLEEVKPGLWNRNVVTFKNIDSFHSSKASEERAAIKISADWFKNIPKHTRQVKQPQRREPFTSSEVLRLCSV